jgi:hypothetical protein
VTGLFQPLEALSKADSSCGSIRPAAVIADRLERKARRLRLGSGVFRIELRFIVVTPPVGPIVKSRAWKVSIAHKVLPLTEARSSVSAERNRSNSPSAAALLLAIPSAIPPLRDLAKKLEMNLLGEAV